MDFLSTRLDTISIVVVDLRGMRFLATSLFGIADCGPDWAKWLAIGLHSIGL